MYTPVSKNELLIGAEFTDRIIELIDNAERSVYIFMLIGGGIKTIFPVMFLGSINR